MVLQNKISVYEYGAEQKDYCMKINNLYKSLYKTRTPKAFVKTYGCQQNVSDSEKYKPMLFFLTPVQSERMPKTKHLAISGG